MPHLGFLRWDDLRADESFSSYDHQRVLIFKNTLRLEADTIARQVLEVRILADPWELLEHPALEPVPRLPG